MVNSDRLSTYEQSEPKGGAGCWHTLLVPLVAIWISAVIAICQFAIWILEQNYFNSVVPPTDPRWIIGLVGGVAIWLPSILLSRNSRSGAAPDF